MRYRGGFSRGAKLRLCPKCGRKRYTLNYKLTRGLLGFIAYGCHHEWAEKGRAA